MLGQYGEVYLLDWGLAIDTEAPMGTNAGTVGTPHYLAPEMISGEPHMVDERTDVYLLGATLHYLLVGRPRHDAPTSLGAAVLAAESKPYVYGSDVFRELGALANRACALNPSERPQTVAAFRLRWKTVWRIGMRCALQNERSPTWMRSSAQTYQSLVLKVAKRFEALHFRCKWRYQGGQNVLKQGIHFGLRCAMTEHCCRSVIIRRSIGAQSI